MIITNEFVFFYSGREIYSNWHRTPRQFVDPLNNNLAFDCTEQAFMWWKAVFHQDHKIATLCETTTDPQHVKALGRQITGYNDKAWECVRLGFMTYVNLLKFQQNPEFAKQLKETGRRTLVEASEPDRVWGVGMNEEKCVKYVETGAIMGGWPGRNLLGEALMTVRSLL